MDAGGTTQPWRKHDLTPGLVLDYARMLQQVTERQHQRWWLKLREMWTSFALAKAKRAGKDFSLAVGDDRVSGTFTRAGRS